MTPTSQNNRGKHGFDRKYIPKLIYDGFRHILIMAGFVKYRISKYLFSFLKGNHQCQKFKQKISGNCWLKHGRASLINPPVTARVTISQNVDILARVYLVHLKVEHCQTLHVVSTFTGQNESAVFDW